MKDFEDAEILIIAIALAIFARIAFLLVVGR